MSKLTKKEIQTHTKALELLEHGTLSEDEKLFVFDNYREDAYHINSQSGAFFTPFGLARDLSIHIPYTYRQMVTVIDLCAGIGILSYAAAMRNNYWSRCPLEITCVEINPDYIEIGKKLLPDARWICGDALDPDFLRSLGHFDFAISNPPFGNIASNHRKMYRSGLFEYMVIEAAAKIADDGAFIIPQMSAPFVFSTNINNNLYWRDEGRAKKFEEKTGITLEFNLGIDTAQYTNKWHGVAPVCEIVCCDFTEKTGQLTLDMAVPA
jgi:hypothetical protein